MPDTNHMKKPLYRGFSLLHRCTFLGLKGVGVYGVKGRDSSLTESIVICLTVWIKGEYL